MPLIRQKMILRDDLIANPDNLYLFGDNAARYGMGGQAKEMRGESNAHGIRTKWLPSRRREAFFSDSQLQQIREMIDDDFEILYEFIHAGGTIIVPEDGLGTGLSEMDSRAPKAFEYLVWKLERLEKLVDTNGNLT